METGKPIKTIKLKNGAIRRIYAHGPNKDLLAKAVSKHMYRVLNTNKQGKKGSVGFIKFINGAFSGKK